MNILHDIVVDAVCFFIAELIKTTKVYATFRTGFVFRRKTESLLQEYMIRTRSAIFRTSRIFCLILHAQGWTSFLLSLGNRYYCCYTLWDLNYFGLQCSIDFVFLVCEK